LKGSPFIQSEENEGGGREKRMSTDYEEIDDVRTQNNFVAVGHRDGISPTREDVEDLLQTQVKEQQSGKRSTLMESIRRSSFCLKVDRYLCIDTETTFRLLKFFMPPFVALLIICLVDLDPEKPAATKTLGMAVLMGGWWTFQVSGHACR